MREEPLHCCLILGPFFIQDTRTIHLVQAPKDHLQCHCDSETLGDIHQEFLKLLDSLVQAWKCFFQGPRPKERRPDCARQLWWSTSPEGTIPVVNLEEKENVRGSKSGGYLSNQSISTNQGRAPL